MAISNKLFLFNLCENSEISSRTILRLYNGLEDNVVSEAAIKVVLGDTNTAKDIIDNLNLVNEDRLSIYTLLMNGIANQVIETLKENFDSLEELYDHISELKTLNLQDRTIDKIKEFFQIPEVYEYIRKSNHVDEYDLILSELSKLSSPILIPDFYKLIASKFDFKNIHFFTETINKLIASNKILITGNGISVKSEKLTTYLTRHRSERDVEMLEYYLSNNTLEETAKKYGVTRQRVNQIIEKKISRLPEFYKEKDIRDTMAVYKFNSETIGELFLEEPMVPYYVKTKYKFNPLKTEVDYVIENNLIDKPQGLKILKRNHCAFIQDKLYKINFNSLFQKYLDDKEIYSFKLKEQLEPFKAYLKEYNINFENEVLKGVSYETKVAHADFLLNCGNNHIYYHNEERYSEQFLTKAREYLENFYGYGYVDFFYNSNTQLCNDNKINNTAELFAVLKKIFEEEFKENIEFIRNPSIRTPNLDTNSFISDLIEELQPIKVEDFVGYLEKNYGIKKANFVGAFHTILLQYKTDNGFLTTQIKEIDESDPVVIRIREFLKDNEIVGLKYFICNCLKDLSKKDIEIYSSKSFIKRLGYKITNNAIYKHNYNSAYEAIECLCNSLDVAIDQTVLSKFYPVNQVDNKYDSIKQNCLLLRFSETNFLNVQKMIDRSVILEFRKGIEGILESGEIYTLKKLCNSLKYQTLLEKYPEVDKLIQALNNTLLISIIQSSSIITYMDYGEFIFSKGVRISAKQIIRNLLNKEDSIERSELIEILDSEYGIDIENQGASYFAELGFYYSSINNTVYKSKELYNEELTNYLNSTEVN